MSLEITKIRMTKGNWGKIRAFVTFTINNALTVEGAKIIEGNSGLFIGMPSVEKKGNFKDVCYPATKEARDIISEALLNAYDDNNQKTTQSTNNKQDDLFD